MVEILAIRAHQINERRMVHEILPVLVNHDLGKISFVGARNSLDLFHGTRQCHDRRVKIAHIIGQDLNRVPLWIHGNHQRLYFLGRRSQNAQGFRNQLQFRRADIGAIRKAEHHEQVGPAIIGVAYSFALMVYQLERTTDGGDAGNSGVVAVFIQKQRVHSQSDSNSNHHCGNKHHDPGKRH